MKRLEKFLVGESSLFPLDSGLSQQLMEFQPQFSSLKTTLEKDYPKLARHCKPFWVKKLAS